MYRKILAVIDGSENSQSVVDQAIAMATAFRADIHVLQTASSHEEICTAITTTPPVLICKAHRMCRVQCPESSI